MYKKVVVSKVLPKSSRNFDEALQIIEELIPKPGKEDVVIKVYFNPVNNCDGQQVLNNFVPKKVPPYEIGIEVGGYVTAVGDQVPKHIKVGMAVAATGLPMAYREYSMVNWSQVVPLPELNEKFAALVATGTTPIVSLSSSCKIKSDQVVLITAAAGANGHIGVQWAKLKGCTVIGTVSSVEKEKFCKSIGCDYVINYKNKPIVDKVRKLYPNGIDVVWDVIGCDQQIPLMGLLKPGGIHLSLGYADEYRAEKGPIIRVPISQIIKQQITLEQFIMFSNIGEIPFYFGELIKYVQSGKIALKVDFGETVGEFVGLESTGRAMAYLESGRNIGKVTIKIPQK